MGEVWLEYNSTRLYTLLVPVLTKTHTTAHDAHTNVQVLAEYGSTTLHTLLMLVLTDNQPQVQTAHANAQVRARVQQD